MLERIRDALVVILLAASFFAAFELTAKKLPEIADPDVKRLVEEACEARQKNDSMRALVKLEEAWDRAPKDPNVLYERAQLFEEMSEYDPRLKKTAAEGYQAIFELGEEKAGSLHEIAAKKLADGL